MDAVEVADAFRFAGDVVFDVEEPLFPVADVLVALAFFVVAEGEFELRAACFFEFCGDAALLIDEDAGEVVGFALTAFGETVACGFEEFFAAGLEVGVEVAYIVGERGDELGADVIGDGVASVRGETGVE